MTFDIKDIARSLNPGLTLQSNRVTRLMTDSRIITCPADTLFVALRTANNDGHAFVQQLIDRGVRAFIVDHIDPSWQYDSTVSFITVSDTAEALRGIGLLCRSRLRGTVVGITGSIGKTTLKEYINRSIGGNRSVSRSPRSYNSSIGVPLALWQLDENADAAVIEAGISQEGEMAALQQMIRPDIGILTVITDEHANGFASRRSKIDEKLKLFDTCHTVLYNADDPDQAKAVESLAGKQLIGVHAGSDGNLNGISAYLKPLAQLLGCEADGNPALDPPISTRLDIIDGLNSCRIVCNRLSGDALSLRGALEFVRRQALCPAKTTLITDSDSTSDAEMDEIKELAAEFGINRLVATSYAAPGNISGAAFHDEVIVVNYSSVTPTDHIVAILEDKQHETLMEVNLDAMVHNFNFFRSKVKPTTGIICMLKAHGYGAGSVELARMLEQQGAAYIAVAVVDEGIELRHNGITMPIIVLNPRASDLSTLMTYRLEPEVYSFELLDALIRHFTQYGVKDFPIHLKLDTGMRRLGFLLDDTDDLARRLSATDTVKASSVFSHLACADDPAEDDYTRGQFAYFAKCCEALSSKLPYAFHRHILNSTGIVRFPEYQYDYVRLGIGLYGVPTLFDGSMSELRNVSRLTSPIISLKQWKAGDTVGYNRRGRLTRESTIATVPVGYADGIDRHLGYGNASFTVNGHLCPTVGSICMDICMIDVTGVTCKVGDRVEIFGDTITPQMLADTLTTIPYEILTSISPRVKRVYYRE